MQNISQDEVFKRFQKLPEAVKDAMFAEATADKIEELGRKYNLLLDKIGELANEVGLFMLGVTRPEEFPSRLRDALGLPDIKTKELVEEINQTIFKPIREHLLALHNTEESRVEFKEAPKGPTFAPGSVKSTPAPVSDIQKPNVAPFLFPEKPPVTPPPQQPASTFAPARIIPPAPTYQLPQQAKQENIKPAEVIRQDDPYHEAID